jgi:flagellar protein FliS
MNAANMANTYKNQQIMTASPEQLTLMLYNGALRFIAESLQALDQKDIPKAHNSNMKAQAIMREFIRTFDMQYKVSENWVALYDYILRCLIEGNMKKDKAKLEEAREMLAEFRDVWIQVIKKARAAQAVGT